MLGRAMRYARHEGTRARDDHRDLLQAQAVHASLQRVVAALAAGPS